MSTVEKMYTLTEIMTMLKLGRRTFYRHIVDGKMKAVKIGRKWAVKESDLQEFLARGTNVPESDIAEHQQHQ